MSLSLEPLFCLIFRLLSLFFSSEKIINSVLWDELYLRVSHIFLPRENIISYKTVSLLMKVFVLSSNWYGSTGAHNSRITVHMNRVVLQSNAAQQ